MSVLAALLVAAAARVDSIAVVERAGAPAVRLAISSVPEAVSVRREGDVARVSLRGVRLGPGFAGGQRFTWLPRPDTQPPAPAGARLGRLDVVADESELRVDVAVSAATGLELRRAPGAVWLVLYPVRRAEAKAAVGFASLARHEPPDEEPPPAPAAGAPAPAPTPTPTPAPPADTHHDDAASPPPAPAEDVAGLARGLFPADAAPGDASAGSGDDVAALYPRLFPAGAPEATPEPQVDAPVEPGLPLGPFRLRAAADTRYVDADTFLDTTPTRDRYLEVAPRLAAAAPVAGGRFTLEYKPVLRAFATYDRINSTTQLAGASAELPLGTLALHAAERFVSGTLDTRLVDPGGEYFYGLGRFHRNDLDAGARVALGSRLGLELSGAAGRVHFVEESSFFDYDSRSASAGLALELAPGLTSRLTYSYDTIPRPVERPEAEARAHSVRASLDGDILPLLSGQLSLGYRSQRNPAAGEGGRSFSGFVASGILNQRLGRESLVSFYVSRSTPASAFETNGFYVATSVQAAAELPLPLSLQLRGGLGYQWSDYRAVAAGLAAPRHDRLLDWYLALRRPLPHHLTLSGNYRSAHRDSNLDSLDTDSSGLVLQLEWDPYAGSGR